MDHDRLSGDKNARNIYNDIGFSSIGIGIIINYSLLVEPTPSSGKNVLKFGFENRRKIISAVCFLFSRVRVSLF
jgi:hypothetical protein